PCEVVVRQKPPERAGRRVPAQTQPPIPVPAAAWAAHRHLDPFAGRRRQQADLGPVTERHGPDPEAARLTLLVASPRGAAEAEPAGAVPATLAPVTHEEPHPDEGGAAGGPTARPHRPRTEGAREPQPVPGALPRRQLAAVTPPRLLRELGPSHPHDLDRAEPEQRDVVGRGERTGAVAGHPLQLLQRLPPILDRRERPSPTAVAHGPESPTLRVEGDPPRPRKMLELVVLPERGGANQTVLEHDPSRPWWTRSLIRIWAPECSPAACRRGSRPRGMLLCFGGPMSRGIAPRAATAPRTDFYIPARAATPTGRPIRSAVVRHAPRHRQLRLVHVQPGSDAGPARSRSGGRAERR